MPGLLKKAFYGSFLPSIVGTFFGSIAAGPDATFGGLVRMSVIFSSPFHLYQVYLAYQYTAGRLTPVLGFRRQQRWVEAPREQQYMQQGPRQIQTVPVKQVQTVPRKQIRPTSDKEV